MRKAKNASSAKPDEAIQKDATAFQSAVWTRLVSRTARAKNGDVSAQNRSHSERYVLRPVRDVGVGTRISKTHSNFQNDKSQARANSLRPHLSAPPVMRWCFYLIACFKNYQKILPARCRS